MRNVNTQGGIIIICLIIIFATCNTFSISAEIFPNMAGWYSIALCHAFIPSHNISENIVKEILQSVNRTVKYDICVRDYNEMIIM